MADNPKKTPKELEKATSMLQARMDTLYRATYSADKTPVDSLHMLTADIQSNLKRLSTPEEVESTSILTRFLAGGRRQEAEAERKTNEQILSMFQDKSVTDGLLQDFIASNGLKEFDNEIDMICKYMPSLESALEILKNATLASDSFSKDIINVTFVGLPEEDAKVCAKNFDKMMHKYKLVQKIFDWYDATSHYGEQFVYRVPYKREVKDLLDRRDRTKRLSNPASTTMGSVHEMVLIDEGATPIENSRPEFKVWIDNSGILESGVNEYIAALEAKEAMEEKLTLRAQYMGIVNEAYNKGTLDYTVKDDLRFPGTYADGLTDPNKTPNTSGKNKINVDGVVIKSLKRENIILLYVADVCLGYYYFEPTRRDAEVTFSSKLSPRTTMLDDKCLIHGRQAENRFTDSFIDYVANNIANSIDANFVNKNRDLQKEIYALLKHNDIFTNSGFSDSMKITFIPAEDITHMYFRQDPETHRGISDLEESLLPATFWCCLMLSDLIGQMTRAQDHRVYYVKQTVETNISQTLMNVINQVKKGNMGLRQLQTMNQVLNIVGKYNDYVIPVGQNGESPIQFEVMEGQRLEPKEELKNGFQEEAISKIVPVEMVIPQRADFATQITSMNIQLLRRVQQRQAVLEEHLNDLFTHIYNYEYGTNVIIKTQLPPPLFLVISNLNQIYDSVNQLSNNLGQIMYPEANNDAEEQTKMAYFIQKRILGELQSYLRIDDIDRYMQQAEMAYLAKHKKQDDNMSGGY